MDLNQTQQRFESKSPIPLREQFNTRLLTFWSACLGLFFHRLKNWVEIGPQRHFMTKNLKHKLENITLIHLLLHPHLQHPKGKAWHK